jgi:very-short-patch-repair endonuclease
MIISGVPPAPGTREPDADVDADADTTTRRFAVSFCPIRADTGWADIAAAQDSVISVRTALATGLTRGHIRWQIDRGRWQSPERGVVVTHSGPLTRPQRLWCVLEAVGPPAYLAGPTAAELDGLRGYTHGRTRLLVPAWRTPRRTGGLVVHRSTLLGSDHVHPARTPPRTRLERSLLDMASWSLCDDDARGALAAAIQQRLTTVTALRDALARSGPRPRSALIAVTLDDLDAGAESVAEMLYRRIERRYRLPTGTRQAPVTLDGRRRYLDVLYEPWGVWVEIDGVFHREVHQWWDDLDRQNVGVLQDRLILRFPTHQLRQAPARVAEQVTTALRQRGWPGPDTG